MADFHTSVCFCEPLEDGTHEREVTAVHGWLDGEYKVLHSHADLAPRNILLDPKKGNRITGVVYLRLEGGIPSIGNTERCTVAVLSLT